MITRTMGALAGVVSMALVAGAACGGGGGGSALTLEEYFQQMETIAGDLDQRSNELSDRYDQDVNNAASEEEVLKLTAQFFEDGAAATRSALDRVEKLRPPSEAKDEHEEFLAAGRAIVDLFDGIIERAKAAKSADDIQALGNDLDNPPYSDASKRADDACFALQEVADQNNIDVDLTCGS